MWLFAASVADIVIVSILALVRHLDGAAPWRFLVSIFAAKIGFALILDEIKRRVISALAIESSQESRPRSPRVYPGRLFEPRWESRIPLAFASRATRATGPNAARRGARQSLDSAQRSVLGLRTAWSNDPSAARRRLRSLGSVRAAGTSAGGSDGYRRPRADPRTRCDR